MPVYSKQSTLMEIEYLSLRILNDCDTIKNNGIKTIGVLSPDGQENLPPFGAVPPLRTEAKDAEDKGEQPETFATDDDFEGIAEGPDQSGAMGLPGHFSYRRVMLAFSVLILIGAGIGVIAAFTAIASEPTKITLIEVAPHSAQPVVAEVEADALGKPTAALGHIPPKQDRIGDEGLIQHSDAKPISSSENGPAFAENALVGKSFDDRFLVAGAKAGDDLQIHTQRQPLGQAVARKSENPASDLGIIEQAKSVKTVTIKTGSSPVLGYVPADARVTSTGAGSADGHKAIAEATGRKALEASPDLPTKSPHPEIASALPVAPVEVAVSDQPAALVKAETAVEAAPSGVVTVSVNMREKASNKARIVAVIPPKTELKLGSCDRWWCEVTYSGETGFIGKRYVETES